MGCCSSETVQIGPKRTNDILLTLNCDNYCVTHTVSILPNCTTSTGFKTSDGVDAYLPLQWDLILNFPKLMQECVQVCFNVVLFQLAMKAVPYRKDFIAALGRNKVDEATVLKEMKDFQDLLSQNIDVIEDFYQKNDLDAKKVV